MDVLLLSRLQFALTIMFHYLFPPLTIGMGVVLVYLEGMHLKTKDAAFHRAARFWTKIFALNFAIGVATGLVMEFEFGTNWAVYSRFVGDVFGSALAAEGIFAFFLESGFLAVLVFGWDRVSPRMHFFSTCMVALGSIFSSIWIVVANSWQQTPTGHHIVQMTRDGEPWFVQGEPIMRAEIVDFWQLVFNPSTIHRLIHVWIGCFIMGAAFIISISAWYLLKKRHEDFAKRSLRGALLIATAASLSALVSGHLQANSVYRHQPAKLAAFEAHFVTGPGDLSLIGLPDEKNQTIHGNVAVPGGLSFLIHEDTETPVLGLDKIRPEHRPPLLLSYFSYHAMVGLGTFFVLLTTISCLFLWRGTLFSQRWLLWIHVFAVIGAIAANQLGWVAAEVGRQPWIVHPPVVRGSDGTPQFDRDGFLRYEEIEVPLSDGRTRKMHAGLLTSDGVSQVVTSQQVLSSILMFGFVYVLLFALWVFVLHRKIQAGPAEGAEEQNENPAKLIDAAGAIARGEDLLGNRDTEET